jgi:hypothetical protein
MGYLDTHKICLQCGKRILMVFPRCDCGSKEFSENVVPKDQSSSA